MGIPYFRAFASPVLNRCQNAERLHVIDYSYCQECMLAPAYNISIIHKYCCEKKSYVDVFISEIKTHRENYKTIFRQKV